jgi:hypothetical protein
LRLSDYRHDFIELESMIPYDDIDAVFFDFGGTLVGIDCSGAN